MTQQLSRPVFNRFEAARADAIEKFWSASPAERPATYTLNPAYQSARSELWDSTPASLNDLERKWSSLAGERFAGYPEFIIADLKAMIAAGAV